VSLSAPEVLREALPQVRTFVRKVAELDNEQWLQNGLPAVNGLPDARELARQVVALRDALRDYLRRQEGRYVQYLKEHPPEIQPVAAGALRALPPETVLTYHTWLEGLLEASADAQELADLLRSRLREAVGTGGQAGLRPAGGTEPGYDSLGREEAGALARRLRGLETSADPGAGAFLRALKDRAGDGALQGAVLRDGAGRAVAAATFSTRGTGLAVRSLGALDMLVPGSGLQMVRELAGLAASRGQGVTLTPAPGAETVFADLGFIRGADGRFALSADSALALAQRAPGPSSPAWTRAGWLEGPEATFVLASGAEREAVLAETKRWVRKAVRPLEEGEPEYGLAVLRDAAGRVIAAAQYEMPGKGRDLVVTGLWISPAAPPTAGRRLMRELARMAAAEDRGITVVAPEQAALGFYRRLGLAGSERRLSFTPAQAAAFASGLTREATFLGQLTWELAVAGAADWLGKDVIPGVVDDVSAATHRRLIDTLVEGLNRGEGTNDLIARIRALDETTFGPARAERIARTEVITANRAGAYQIAVEAGAAEKRWVSRLMPNTRPWHREAHGQTRPIREPFRVANRKGAIEELMFPGDRSLGAGPDQIIQCVCIARSERPGVSDEASYDEHGLAGGARTPAPVAAAAPEPVRKSKTAGLEDLRAFVLKDKGWAPGPNSGLFSGGGWNVCC